MMSYFETTTHGKWILAGEHAVIRGHQALVFPIHEKKLTLKFHDSEKELSASYAGESGADTHLLFWSVLEQGMQLLGSSLNTLSGYFSVESNIPIGVGMGASAALCVATARWFVHQKMLPQENIYSFAKELENLFHGQSSGLDIAGVAALQGVIFQQSNTLPLSLSWKPQWFLSSCGQIGITSHCIHQVQELWKKNRALAHQIDLQMVESVNLAKEALFDSGSTSVRKLANAINEAATCFQQWGLVSDSLQSHMNYLMQAGAIAVKPTGSGGGGYVVSLWQTEPPLMSVELISI